MNDLPVIAPDSFAAFRDLLALIGDPKRSMRVLNQLEDKFAKVEEAERRLAERSAAFEQASSKTRAELEDKASKLRAKEISLIGREAIAERTLERETADRLARARPLSQAGTITREA